MENYKIIKKDNLLNNINYCKQKYNNLCLMVKANAYGNGLKYINKIISDKINFFGVANIDEALKLRKLNKNAKILIVGKINNYKKVILNNISITIDSLQDCILIDKITKKINKKAYVHIAINTGMNRLGLCSKEQFMQILNFIEKSDYLILEGIFTHTFDSDYKQSHFYEQMQKFYSFVKLLKNKKILIHIGGSYVLNYKIPNFINMVRIGYFAYGYGNKNLKPIMTIKSKVVKIADVSKNEFVGYGKKILTNSTRIAIIPIGYADGISREFANNSYININGHKVKIISVCMDMIIVDILDYNFKIGDYAIIDNLKILNKKSNKSIYEIMTGFNNFRGKTIIV